MARRSLEAGAEEVSVCSRAPSVEGGLGCAAGGEDLGDGFVRCFGERGEVAYCAAAQLGSFSVSMSPSWLAMAAGADVSLRIGALDCDLDAYSAARAARTWATASSFGSESVVRRAILRPGRAESFA